MGAFEVMLWCQGWSQWVKCLFSRLPWSHCDMRRGSLQPNSSSMIVWAARASTLTSYLKLPYSPRGGPHDTLVHTHENSHKQPHTHTHTHADTQQVFVAKVTLQGNGRHLWRVSGWHEYHCKVSDLNAPKLNN